MAQMNGYMDLCSVIEFKGKGYLSRSATLWKGTDNEVTKDFAEKDLDLELLNEETTFGEHEGEAWTIDESIAGFVPRICLTDLPDDEFARYCEEEFYDNEP